MLSCHYAIMLLCDYAIMLLYYFQLRETVAYSEGDGVLKPLLTTLTAQLLLPEKSPKPRARVYYAIMLLCYYAEESKNPRSQESKLMEEWRHGGVMLLCYYARLSHDSTLLDAEAL